MQLKILASPVEISADLPESIPLLRRYSATEHTRRREQNDSTYRADIRARCMIKIKEAIYGSYDGETLPLTDPEVNRVFKRTLVTFCLSRMRSHPQERNKLVSLFKEEMERFFQPQP